MNILNLINNFNKLIPVVDLPIDKPGNVYVIIPNKNINKKTINDINRIAYDCFKSNNLFSKYSNYIWHLVYKDKVLAGCIAIDNNVGNLNNYLTMQYGNNRNIPDKIGNKNIDCFIWNLCVDSSFRSNGYGKDLVKKSIKKICENNKNKITALSIKDLNLLKFYNKLGFKQLNYELPIVMINNYNE